MGWSPALQAGNSDGFDSHKVHRTGMAQLGARIPYKDKAGSSSLSVGTLSRMRCKGHARCAWDAEERFESYIFDCGVKVD